MKGFVYSNCTLLRAFFKLALLPSVGASNTYFRIRNVFITFPPIYTERIFLKKIIQDLFLLFFWLNILKKQPDFKIRLLVLLSSLSSAKWCTISESSCFYSLPEICIEWAKIENGAVISQIKDKIDTHLWEHHQYLQRQDPRQVSSLCGLTLYD